MNTFRSSAAYLESSTFTPEGLLREARRQKGLAAVPVPPVCVLDPDGDVVRMLRGSGDAERDVNWPCYHTELLRFQLDGAPVGIVGCAVGAPFAVLVAEELFASGCELLISITSAGQLSTELGAPPYFILIASAWRDEGTSHHYLPPSERVDLDPALLELAREAMKESVVRTHVGETWTTDAPFRETAPAIAHFRDRGAAAVEMEAAALYAFAHARGRPVVCYAHVTNQMAARDGDFEKGRDNGAHDALEIVRLTMKAWHARPVR